MLPEQQQRILGYFIEEARDHLNTIEQGLLNLESTLNDPEMISEVFRAAHSIKGGAAMLGLTSIQHTSHRLEDCFKVLKEHPVQIDQKLESLFLGVSDTLKALLEHLSAPFGLSEETANTLMSETEPVFQWLNEHLEQLVQQGNSGVTTPCATEVTGSIENVSTLTELFLRRDIPSLAEDAHQESIEKDISVVPQEVLSSANAKENQNWSEFQAQVLQILRQMLQLFKQTTTSSTRQNLEECCYQLVKLGLTWNLSKWCGLCEAAASAITNPQNTYLTLAKIVITEIKQAQELVLQDREAEIAISQQLEALLNFAEIELLEIPFNLVDEQSPPKPISQKIEETEHLAITNLSEPIEEFKLDDDINEYPSLELQQISLNATPVTNFTLIPHEEVHPISKNLDPNGPEVGIAELNTLADLFEGETPDLDENWQQEETLDITVTNELGIDFSSSETNDSDLSDLLSFDEDTDNEQQTTITANTEDLSLLFGENFIEKENYDLQNQQTSPLTKELNDITIDNLDFDSFSAEIYQISDSFINTEQPSLDIDQKNDNENDVLADLLALTLDDDNELLITGEITEPENEASASIKLSSNQENSLDNLFLETENRNWVEEITSSDYIELTQPKDLSLDNLFGDDIEENSLLATSDSKLSDLFDISLETTTELSQPEDDFSNFWNQETTGKPENEFDSIVENNLQNTLEKDLFIGIDNDIFTESQESIASYDNSFDLDNFNLNFPEDEQLDILSSDYGDDLFEDLAPKNLTIYPEISQSEALTSLEGSSATLEDSVPLFGQHPVKEEIHNLSQQPETVDFIPEFTNQPSEISTVDYSQTSSDVELNSFSSFDKNLQLLFEDVAIHDSTYIQMEITDDVVDELSTPETLELAQAQSGDLFGSFDENIQLLFEDVTIHDSTYIQMEITNDVVDELSTPEALELAQTQSGDLFGYFDENTQLLFEDVAIHDSTYIQMEITDDVLDELSTPETSTSLQRNLEVLNTENYSLEAALEFADNAALESTELSLKNNLLLRETPLLEVEVNSIVEELSTVNEFAQTIIQVTVEIDKNLDKNLVTAPLPTLENAVGVTEESTVTEIIEVVTLEDDFANLEALLKEEVPPAKAKEIPEVDFAALEELLGTDNNQAAVSSAQPSTQSISAKNAAFSPRIDEFSDLEKLLAEADQTISHSALTKSNTNKTPRPSSRRAARFEETMKVPVKQLDDMSNLVGELVVNRNTLEQDHERLRQSLDNLLIQVQQLSDVGARMQELYERSLLEASLLAGRKAKDSGFDSQDSNSDRGFSELEMDRFTPFHTLSQQMIERIVRVRESASDIDFVTEETERVARQFRQVTTQLQEGLTRARMVPFAQTIDRWRRGVRDNAIKCGKQVELVIEGGDTLIDKMILDHLTDPLTHMLNNAIAHGIETPEQRQAAGKPPVGIITIRAFHQGNQTVISVGDDGAGIDPAGVKAKAVKIGMITEAQAKTISRLEVYDLLFHSGFSIKDQADEISGRGVGMDVVRSAISEIRGTVNTDSAIGKGTTFTIRLPLTLSICKALCCVSDRARIAFPMDGVEDTLDISVKNIQHNANGQSFISWRDTLLPFRPLKELLTFNRQITRGNVYGGNRDDDMVSVVVVRSANTLIALQIDLVLSEQEIVIKQFEGPAPKPIGVAGATVLGDGRIMPIADVLEIIDIFQGRISTQVGSSSWQQKTTPTDTPATKIDPTVLIVDDSITVRELLSLTFSKAGYRVEQARDGQEAWDKLRSGLPCDIVFCDIEMPRCDGLELLSRIQKDSNLNHLPIAMLTSRGADKHRQMAVQLGASGYFTKPYLEEALLEAAGRMVKGEKLVS
ncbi:response regulator [Nostoc sp. PA-18-2419]|uniref:hybrid sensor histidine kinase/response regulator n=1 Tax=Nostoc sp. PA-18-2419 TaxID=2575443 RepID=UPI0011093D68|nr:response regulator [Nostoc sp. PA-18-2419]